MPRCPECNHKAPGHAKHCRAGIDESRPMTSAERYAGFQVGDYGRADADIAPTGGDPNILEAIAIETDPRPAEDRWSPLEPEHFGTAPGFKEALAWARASNEARAPGTPWKEGAQSLPVNALARKELPLATGLLDYFPAALIAVAALSRIGNEQHNPGQPMHWARGKSGDEADALLRHLVDRGTTDTDGIRHSTKVAWRALALLQKELEAAGLAPISRGSR